MAKFYGAIGFASESKELEDQPGVWKETIIEKYYYGDVIKNTRRLESQDSTNDNISISNTISIVADAYATLNFFAIRYVQWMGSKWKVTNVDVERPRLNLTLGGLYNEEST